MDDRRITKAKETIFDAVRFLAPDEVERLLREMADSMKRLADQYDDNLHNIICK
jgi:hypothetical protein